MLKVKVGILKATQRGKLTARVGLLPVDVPEDASRQSLLDKAVAKHHLHSQNVLPSADYILLYSSHKVVEKLPGKEEAFRLDRYKRDLGKSFSKINFYLCPLDDFNGWFFLLSLLHLLQICFSNCFKKYSISDCLFVLVASRAKMHAIAKKK